MTAVIDEQAAWDLIRSITPGSVQGRTRVHRSSRHDEWLEIEPPGTWTSSHPTTDSARELLELFLPIRLPADLVIGQLGQSLDGRIATEDGESHFVTGPEDIERLHRLRALVDAVVVGAGTIEADDPQLTVRRVEGRSPVRVVLDPKGRLDPERKVFSDDAVTTLVVRQAGAGHTPGTQAEILLPAGHDGRLDVLALLEALRERGLRKVLVEGGGLTVSRFLEAGALDRLHVTVAPVVIGSGRRSLTLDPITSLDQALRPACRCFRMGQDVLFDLDLG